MKSGTGILDLGSGSGEMFCTWRGEPYWRQVHATEEIAQACGILSLSDFFTLPELDASFDEFGYDLVGMVLIGKDARDRYEAAKWVTMRDWLEENTEDDFVQEVRAELTIAPKRHVYIQVNTVAGACLNEGHTNEEDPRQVKAAGGIRSGCYNAKINKKL